MLTPSAIAEHWRQQDMSGRAVAAWAIPPVLSPGRRPPGSRCRRGDKAEEVVFKDRLSPVQTRDFRDGRTPPAGQRRTTPTLPPPRTLRFCGDQGVALELAHVAASRTHCVSRTAALPEAPETSWPPVPLAVAGAAGVRRAAALLLARRSSRPPTPPADFPIRASLPLSASRGAGSGVTAGGRGPGAGPGTGTDPEPGTGEARPERGGAWAGAESGGLDWGGAGCSVGDRREGARVAGYNLRNWGADRGMTPARAVAGSRCWVRQSGCVTRRKGAVGRSSAPDGKGRVGEIALSESPLRPHLLLRASLPPPRLHLNSASSYMSTTELRQLLDQRLT